MQLQYMRWRQVAMVELRFKGHKVDQEQMGSVRVRTQTEVRGSKSSLGYTAAPMPLCRG